MKSRRATRIKAAELAAQCLGSEMAAGGAVAARLFGLVIFFELYIDHGANKTEAAMKLMGGRRKAKLRVIAGGNLTR
jgi:hypothetical protein